MDVREEEFANFMQKVSQVERIVRRMTSADVEEQQRADCEAKQLLGEDVQEKFANLQVEEELKVTSDRSVLNTKEPKKKTEQEQFMSEVSRDADERYRNRQVRLEKMETIKKQATKVFQRGEYERALTLYTKAIELIKDSPLLYNNRALCYIRLKLHEKALIDLEWALRLNETCLRAMLLQAKCFFELNNMEKYEKCIKECLTKNPKDEKFIRQYEKEIKGTHSKSFEKK